MGIVREAGLARAALLPFLFSLAAVLVVPIWSVKYPPLLDYPNHLASTFVLAHITDTHYKFSDIYRAQWGFYPFVAMDVILLGLQRIVSVELAGRLFLSLCLLALPVAVWFFLKQANPDHAALALWVLPFSYHAFFLSGYLGYCLSLSVCFVALALWLRYLDRPSTRRWISLVIVFTVLYLVHTISFAVGAIAVISHALFKRQSLKQLVLLGLVFAPAAVFFLISRPDAVGHGIQFQSPRAKLGWLLGVLRGESRAFDIVTFSALAACGVIALWKNANFRWSRDWLVVSTVLFGLYCVVPIGYNVASDLDVRILPIAYILLLAVARPGGRTRWIVGLAVLLFLGQTAVLSHWFAAEQPRLIGLARSFETVQANAYVLPLVETQPTRHIPSYPHFWAYGVIRRGWLSPYLFTLPGDSLLTLHDAPYVPAGAWFSGYREPPNWGLVQDTYDYVWGYNVPRFSHPLAGIGKLVFAADGLEVYRIVRRVSIRSHSSII